MCFLLKIKDVLLFCIWPFFAGWVHFKKNGANLLGWLFHYNKGSDHCCEVRSRLIASKHPGCGETSSSVNLYHQWGGSPVVILIIKKSMLHQMKHWWQNCTLPSTKRYTCANTFQNGCIQSSDLDVNTIPHSVHTSTIHTCNNSIQIVNIFRHHDRCKRACLHCFQCKPNRLLPSKQWSVPNSCRYVRFSSWDCQAGTNMWILDTLDTQNPISYTSCDNQISFMIAKSYQNNGTLLCIIHRIALKHKEGLRGLTT